MTTMNTVNPPKNKRKRLHVYPRNLLAISGVLQVCFLQVHIGAIIRMTNVIIGFYLLAFILTSTINILNGFSFSSKASKGGIIATSFVTLLQILFGALYSIQIVTETGMFTSPSTLPIMIVSVILFIFGMASALIAVLLEVNVYRKADDIYQYMM